MDGLEVLPARVRRFVCAGCGVPQVSLWEELPAARLCGACRQGAAGARDALAAAREAGVPARFCGGWSRELWAARFGALPAALAGWDGRRSVLAWGPTGTGKTGLLTLLLLERLKEVGRGALWIRGQALLEALRGGVGLGAGAEAQAAEAAARQALRRAQGVELLLVDDLFAGALRGGGGAPEVSPWVRERLLAVLAHRYDAALPTLATTMASPVELGRLDMSLASRLLDAGGLVVAFAGRDRRMEP